MTRDWSRPGRSPTATSRSDRPYRCGGRSCWVADVAVPMADVLLDGPHAGHLVEVGQRRHALGPAIGWIVDGRDQPFQVGAVRLVALVHLEVLGGAGFDIDLLALVEMAGRGEPPGEGHVVAVSRRSGRRRSPARSRARRRSQRAGRECRPRGTPRTLSTSRTIEGSCTMLSSVSVFNPRKRWPFTVWASFSLNAASPDSVLNEAVPLRRAPIASGP